MSLAECERAVITVGDAVVDAIVGYRAWQLTAKDGRARLRSLHVKDVYWTDETMTAVCRCMGGHGGIRSAIQAEQDCRNRCGLYAWWRAPSHILASADKIWGTVYLWGDVVVHEKAVRAQYARIGGFYPIGYSRQRRIVEMAAAQFGVPLLQVPEKTTAVYAKIQETHNKLRQLKLEGSY